MVTDNKTNRLNSRIRMWISFLANMAKRVNIGAVVYYALDLTLQMRSIYWQSACVTPPVLLSSTGIALEKFHRVPSGHECWSGHFDPWRHQLWPRSSTTSTGFSATPLTGYFLRLDPAPTDCTGLPACWLQLPTAARYRHDFSSSYAVCQSSVVPHLLTVFLIVVIF